MASKQRSYFVLKNRSDFLNILKNGKRIRIGGWVVLNYLPNQLGVVRCGWTLPRKVGKAVTRNRLKRWSRVFFSHHLCGSKQLSVDVNVVFLKSDDDFYKKLDYERFSKQMATAWAILEKRI